MPGLIDRWIMKTARRGVPVNYGLARGFGSLGFAAAGIILGTILERHGLAVMFPVYAALAGRAESCSLQCSSSWFASC